MKLNIDYFREKSLDAFIRGLPWPFSILLQSSKPKALRQAYQFCVEYYDMDIRTASFKNELGGQPIPKTKRLPDL